MSCIPRLPRKHPAIDKYGSLFAESFHNREYEKAAKFVFLTFLEMQGSKGIMNILENINRIIERKKYIQRL